MGQLGGRRQDDQFANQLGGSGQGLWLESCTRCGQPLTVIAPEKPLEPTCDDCSPAPPR